MKSLDSNLLLLHFKHNVIGLFCVFFYFFLLFFLSFFQRLHVNEKRYHVQPPKRATVSLEETEKLGDVRALVAQVF